MSIFASILMLFGCLQAQAHPTVVAQVTRAPVVTVYTHPQVRYIPVAQPNVYTYVRPSVIIRPPVVVRPPVIIRPPVVVRPRPTVVIRSGHRIRVRR